VFFGAPIATEDVASNPGRKSPSAGMSGNAGERAAEVLARSVTRLDRAYGFRTCRKGRQSGMTGKALRRNVNHFRYFGHKLVTMSAEDRQGRYSFCLIAAIELPEFGQRYCGLLFV
jgi:hypothetical protein